MSFLLLLLLVLLLLLLLLCFFPLILGLVGMMYIVWYSSVGDIETLYFWNIIWYLCWNIQYSFAIDMHDMSHKVTKWMTVCYTNITIIWFCALNLFLTFTTKQFIRWNKISDNTYTHCLHLHLCLCFLHSTANLPSLIIRSRKKRRKRRKQRTKTQQRK